MGYTVIKRTVSVPNSKYQLSKLYTLSDEQIKAVRMPRAKRSKATLPRVKRLNDKRSRDLFEVTVEGNFDVGDYFITITFPDGMSDEQREKEFRNFLRRLDYSYRKHGKTLLFIYVDERGDELGHLHYHLLINSIPEVSRKVIEKILFKSKAMQAGEYPDVRKIVRDEKSGLLALILYLGKQFKHGAPNKRRWSCSRSIKRLFPNILFLDAALHGDEPSAAPHIQLRKVYAVSVGDGEDKHLEISQKDALAAMGIERPDLSKPEGRNNNAKMTYTAITREKWLDIAESHGIEIEREPQAPSQNGRTLLKLKCDTLKEEVKQLTAEKDTTATQIISDFVSGRGAKKVAAAEKIINNAEMVNETICKANVDREQQLTNREERANKREQILDIREAEQKRKAQQLAALQRTTEEKARAVEADREALAIERKSFAQAVAIKARQIVDKVLRSLGIRLNRGYDLDSQINLAIMKGGEQQWRQQ